MAIEALVPISRLMQERSVEEDPELDKVATVYLDAITVLAATNSPIRWHRRELIKPFIEKTYSKELLDKNSDPNWLFGGDLTEMAKSVRRKLNSQVG